MSASRKKALRNKDASLLTEKQLAELKEQKKTRAYTIGFVVVIVLLLAVAIFAMGRSLISGSGILEKKTVAATVNGHDISNAELSYYYVDSVNDFYKDLSNSYGDNANLYCQLFYGLDLSKPLGDQKQSEETTWADYFISDALSSVKSTYALYEAAVNAGITLTEEENASLDTQIASLKTYGAMNGYSNVKDFLKAIYGNGATEESYRDYMLKNTLASKAFNAHLDSLSYTDSDIRAKEAENYNAFTSYSANYYYLSSTPFLTGGTTDEDGKTTYSDEEKAAALAEAEKAAQALASVTYATVEEFDAAIAAMPQNAESETPVASSAITHQLYGNLNSLMQEWLSDSGRKFGDVTVINNESTDADGNTTVNGYYVMFFVASDDNAAPMANVRHLLVSFQASTLDEEGKKVVTDKDKKDAHDKAETLLLQWKSGEATAESFAALVSENTDDTASKSTGGLYENINPDSNYVESFLNWAIDPSRQVGDFGIVETEYGYHIMYLDSFSELTYRDTMIQNSLINSDMQEWYNGVVDTASFTEKNTSRMNRDLILNVSSN